MSNTESRNSQNSKPIGIFDSGLGGLTVLGPLIDNLPAESTVYLGDLAHTPFGEKSPGEIRKFAVEGLRFLASHDIKAMIVACNSASSVAMADLMREASFPVFDVISPGAKMAALHSKSRSIGVIGTPATISSGAYELELKSLDINLRIFQADCPQLAPMIEKGIPGVSAYVSVIGDCLTRLPMSEIDTLILGCTHYPLVRDIFRAVCGEEVRLIDSGLATAEAIEESLRESGTLVADPHDEEACDNIVSGTRDYFVTSTQVMNHMEVFRNMAQEFLGVELLTIKEARISERKSIEVSKANTPSKA
jgi:glutamate racemase